MMNTNVIQFLLLVKRPIRH